MNLSFHQVEILGHCVNRAAGGRFCGGGDHLEDLVARGLMRYIGTPEWCPDPFYSITEAGRAALKETQPTHDPNQ